MRPTPTIHKALVVVILRAVRALDRLSLAGRRLAYRLAPLEFETARALLDLERNLQRIQYERAARDYEERTEQ